MDGTSGRSLGVLDLRSAGGRRGGAKLRAPMRGEWRVEANSSRIVREVNLEIGVQPSTITG